MIIEQVIEIPVLIVEVKMFLPHDDGASVDWSLASHDSFLPNNNFPPGLLPHKRIIHDVIQNHMSARFLLAHTHQLSHLGSAALSNSCKTPSTPFSSHPASLSNSQAIVAHHIA